MMTFTFAEQTVEVWPAATAAPLIVLNTFADNGAQVQAALAAQCPCDYTLVAVSGFDWNRDMSPWPAPSTQKDGAPFSGNADSHLTGLVNNVLPAVEAQLSAPPSWRGLAGYSMAGLFAFYALYRTDHFDRVASMSGSFWYPDFLDFACTHTMRRQPQALYFSLGRKEHKTRHPAMQSVQTATEALCAHCRAQHIPTTFTLNPGGHFTDTIQRTASGIAWLLAQ